MVKRSVKRAAAYLPLFGFLFIAAPAFAQECRDHHERATQVCSQMFDEPQRYGLGEGHLKAYENAENIYHRVTYIHRSCLKAVENCERECDRFAYAEEAFAGETASVKLSQIQTRRCGEGGVIYQKAQALGELEEATRQMYEQAKANYFLTEAGGGREPAQSYPTTIIYKDEVHSQSVPESINYNTNPVYFQKQIEEALGHVK